MSRVRQSTFVVIMVGMAIQIHAKRVFSKLDDLESASIVEDASLVVEDKLSIDFAKKRERVVTLVKKGITHLNSVGPERAFNDFLSNPKFVDGDVQIFVDGADGVVYVRPPVRDDIWLDFSKYTNAHGINIQELILKKANQGGGWVSYEWDGGYKESYVEKLTYKDTAYIIGAGWYPISRKMAVENFVRSAIAYFNKNGGEAAFSAFSNKFGDFIKGDLYIFVHDVDGIELAHGQNPSLVGADVSWDEGVRLENEMGKRGESGWVVEKWRNAEKHSFIQIIEYKGKKCVLGAGYYPATNRDSVVDLVKSGVKFFYAWGREKAAAEFSNRGGDLGKFISGEQFLMMCRFDGVVVAHGDNPDMIGQNILELKTPIGRYVIKETIEVAKRGGGWLKYRWNGALLYSYVEKVSDQDGDYFISNGFYPRTQVQEVENLVTSAAEHLKWMPLEESLYVFGQRSGQFIHGSYHLFLFTEQGRCLLYGANHTLVWEDFKDYKLSDGDTLIMRMINKAKNGGGWLSYASRNSTRWVYVRKMKKDGKEYILGSGFYV
ncbi:cache domain-containing protein [Candidatus Babeliales bacterium]|nr:cache domain-containing protein [Candidatus Babeliales bacterium]